jgi:hypothetical protein
MVKVLRFVGSFMIVMGLLLLLQPVAIAPIAAGQKANQAQPVAPIRPIVPTAQLATTFTCPASAAYKLIQVPEEWTTPGTTVNFLSAEINTKYHAPSDSLMCNYNMDGLGHFSWFIYKDVPHGSCTIGANKKSFACK